MNLLYIFFIFLIVEGCSHKRDTFVYYARPPQGLFQEYGIIQNDSERFISVLNLINTGAYKVDEYNSWDRNWGIMKYSFDIFVNEDTITIDQTDSLPNVQKNIFAKKSVYLKTGKLVYEKEVDGSMEREKYNNFDRAGFLVTEKSIHKNFGKITDSTVRSYQYDSSGNIIQENSYNAFGYLSSTIA
jgi:hypothetical protein